MGRQSLQLGGQDFPDPSVAQDQTVCPVERDGGVFLSQTDGSLSGGNGVGGGQRLRAVEVKDPCLSVGKGLCPGADETAENRGIAVDTM